MKLHPEARTTPKLRAEIKASSLPQQALAEQYNVSRLTIRKWQNREEMTDTDKLNTTLTEAQEWLVVELRKTLLLSWDDLTAITLDYINPKASRSGIDRCLRRYGVSRLAVLKRELYGEEAPPKKTFKDYEPGYIHVDIKYLPKMPDEDGHQYLFVAIDRASRMVCLAKTATNAEDFLRKVEQRFPFIIRYVLTDNVKEFTDRFTTQGERAPTGKHKFDQACADLDAEHRLIKPAPPKPMAWWNASTGGSASCLPPPVSPLPVRWLRRSSIMNGSTTTAFHRRPSATTHLLWRSRNGTKTSQICLKRKSMIYRDLTSRKCQYISYNSYQRT